MIAWAVQANDMTDALLAAAMARQQLLPSEGQAAGIAKLGPFQRQRQRQRQALREHHGFLLGGTIVSDYDDTTARFMDQRRITHGLDGEHDPS
mgnify:CR=1 FL=1